MILYESTRYRSHETNTHTTRDKHPGQICQLETALVLPGRASGLHRLPLRAIIAVVIEHLREIAVGPAKMPKHTLGCFCTRRMAPAKFGANGHHTKAPKQSQQLYIAT